MPVAHLGSANARAFQPCLLDQHAGTHAARILEDAAGDLMSQRLASLLGNPLFLHPFGQFVRIVPFELELTLENHQLVQAALSVGEDQVVTLALKHIRR